MPRSIITRIPIRTNRNDNYHKSLFSGIPIDGYTQMVEQMLDGIEFIPNEDYLLWRHGWDRQAKRIVYTGPIDRFFDYEYGRLEWRSLDFEIQVYDYEYHQRVAQINYPESDVKYTRSVEHKHFCPKQVNKTVVTYEYPQKHTRGKPRYYPVNDKKNNELYQKYKKMIPPKFIFGGRLAEYKYYDMDQVIASAMSKTRREI